MRRSEENRARIYETPGKTDTFNFVHSAVLDENYIMVGSHVDDCTRRKIGQGEYVDFSKFQNKLNNEEDVWMEMVNRGGQSFWVPLNDHRESTSITS